LKEKNKKDYQNSKLNILKSKFQTPTSDHRGITLIALVVTIIILLILASISINVIFSDEGVIKRAQRLQEEQKKAELLEKIEIIKLKLQTDEIIDGKEITPEDFFNALEKEGIISDPEIGGGNVEELPKENEDDNPRYEVTTDDDIVIEVEIPKDVEDRPENIKVEYVGPLESLPPKIKIKNTLATTNSITLEVEVTRIESGDKISYYYKKHTDTEYTIFKEGVTDQTINIEGLEQGQTYIIKIITSNAKGQTIKETVGIPLGELPEGTISSESGPIWVGDGTAKLELQTIATVGYIEYQIVSKDEISGEDDLDNTKWVKYTGTITGLKHNDVVFARLTDGTNATESNYSAEVIDEDGPEPATGIENIETTVNTNTEINVTVEHTDEKSGINLSSCKWIYNTTSTMLGVDNAVWNSASGFTEGQPINLVATAPDKYYLHVLSVDRAGNKTETMSNEVTVNQPVTKITLSKTSASIAKGNSTTIKVTLEPENATNKTVNWTTSNSSRATVSPTQTTTSGSSVTVKASSSSTGSVTITATTADGTNLSATCSVSVYTPTVSVTSISVSPSTLTLNVGSTGTLSATISPSNATTKTYKWSSETPSVATVDSNGKVTAVAPGTATIKATSTSGSKTDTCIVTVNPIAVTGVTLSASSVTLDIGATKTLTATVKPDNATNKNVTWSSSNTSVATVSSTGKITAKAIGQSTITVTTKDGSKKATCSVTVNCSDCNNTGTKECGGKLVVTFVEDARELENVKSCWFCDDNVVWKPRIWVECNTCGYETYTVEEHCCGKTECAKACAEKPCTKTIECTH